MLQDGAGSTRQLVDEEGAVNLSVSYTPCPYRMLREGDTMEIYGSGMLNMGYLGGVYDAGTGLIYMGNGQYYDPGTGRFLTRSMNENSTNPYTPWSGDPAGMLIGPFGLIALLFAKKKKHTKLDAFIVVLILFALMGFGSSIAMPVQAASVADISSISSPVVPRSYAVQAESATVGAMYAANPGAPADKVTPNEDCVIKPYPLDYQPVWDFLGGMIYQFVDDYTLGYYFELEMIYQQLRFIILYKLGIQVKIPTLPGGSDAFIEGQKFGRALSEACAQADLAMAVGSWAASIKIGTTALDGVVITGGSGTSIAAPALAISVGLLLLGTFGYVHGLTMSHYIDHNPIDSGGGGGGGLSSVSRLSDEAIEYAVSNEKRLQHAYQHASDLGFGNWNNANKALWKEYIVDILKNPLKSFENKLGKDMVTGYYKVVNGNDVAVYIYKEGQYKGLVATVVKLSSAQMIKFGLP